MDDEDIQEDMDRTTAIGIENLQIIELAANWCEHIDIDNRFQGVGLLEQATGLPISGGSFRCEFAKPSRVSGMVLARTAVDFYEENCIGCPHHKPRGVSPNLGTWADAIIAERNAAARQAEQERVERVERQAARSAARRFAIGVPDPSVQTILDLVDRIDTEDPDSEAADLLLKSAELSPEDFHDKLLEHLAAEAVASDRGVLLEAVFRVFELSGRPPVAVVLDLAFTAIAQPIAAKAAGRMIAGHATQIPMDPPVRRGIVVLAAGSFSFHASEWTGGEPDALARFYDLEPAGAIEALSELLRDDEPWARSTAAHAAKALVRLRPAAGRGLLPALLDCIVIRDGSRYHGDPWAAATASGVVADVLVNDASIDDEVAARMRTADERAARALWKIHWQAAPSRFRETVSNETVALIERRAVALLKEDLPHGLLQTVAETLSYMTDDHGPEVGVTGAELIELLRVWNAKVKAFDTTRPPDPSPMLAFLEWENQRTRAGGIARDVEKALAGWAKGNIAAYVDAIEPLWARTGADALSDDDRASLLKPLKGIETQGELDRATALLTSAMTTGEIWERGAALGALEDMSWRKLTIPDAIQRLIVSNLLNHERVWVIIHAIRALRLVQVTDGERPLVVQFLVNFASTYAREPGRSDDAERALDMALWLSEGQGYEARVKELALQVINAMPSSEAADALKRLHELRTGPEWVGAVIRALEQDDRGGYWFGVHEHQKDDLLRLLSEAPAEWMEPNWDALETTALADLDLFGSYTWAIADLFARHGLHDRAASIAQAVVDNTPNTREKAPRRRMAMLVVYSHRINAAAGDPDEVRRLTDEAAKLSAEDVADDA